VGGTKVDNLPPASNNHLRWGQPRPHRPLEANDSTNKEGVKGKVMGRVSTAPIPSKYNRRRSRSALTTSSESISARRKLPSCCKRMKNAPCSPAPVTLTLCSPWMMTPPSSPDGGDRLGSTDPLSGNLLKEKILTDVRKGLALRLRAVFRPVITGMPSPAGIWPATLQSPIARFGTKIEYQRKTFEQIC
jgi:hypothetical protein